MKTDMSLKGIVTAAIRRKAIDLDSWRWTRLWDDGDPTIADPLARACGFEVGELPILYSYIDHDNWTLFTSRAVWYSNAGRCGMVRVSAIERRDLGFFKGGPRRPIEWLVITEMNGTEHRCPYYTGDPSIGPVYAIDTLRQISSRV